MVVMGRRGVLFLLALSLVVGSSQAFWFKKKVVKEPVAPAPAPAVDQQEEKQEQKQEQPAEQQGFYYFNEVTGESRWTPPQYEFINGEQCSRDQQQDAAVFLSRSSPSLTALSAEAGQAFFLDADTNQAVWEKPASLAWREVVGEEGK
jgi:hypothetical protein